jgi:hypothetical protein
MIALAVILGLVSPSEIDTVVQAIEMAENSPWNSPGGALQFKESTWKEETKLPYSYAQKPVIARKIARERLMKHAAALERLGIKPTAYLLGSAWNKGFTGALRLRKANQKCKYGERVHNIFESLQ